MSEDRELAAIEAIYDALDEGRPDAALELTREVQRGLSTDDPVLRFLAGRALIELDRPYEAAEELARAVELDPEDPEIRTDYAEALFLGCRFADALEQARQAIALDGDYADAHYVLAIALERHGETEPAERHFRHAARLDGERFPAPCRVDAEEFARQLERARAQLPEAFRHPLERVALFVEELPSEELLCEEEPPLNPELLGLFTGVPAGLAGLASTGGELPARIYLFKRNLERSVAAPDELAEQIRITLYHELGHYLGLDEDELERAGYA